MRCSRRIMTTLPVLVLLTSALAVSQSTAPVLDLSSADRKSMKKYFGDAITVKAIPASVIDDPAAYMVQDDGATWTFQVTYGSRRGKTVTATLSNVTQDGATIHRFDSGSNAVTHIRSGDDGNFTIPASENRKNKVISRYDPHEPLLLAGLKPGETRKVTMDVGVYDLDNPDHESHKGTLDVTYKNVGAFEVTVPAGQYDTVLMSWHYKGKVGPANVEDVQYWFFAKGRGPVAMIERSDVSAVLFYHDHEKHAAVLAEAATP